MLRNPAMQIFEINRDFEGWLAHDFFFPQQVFLPVSRDLIQIVFEEMPPPATEFPERGAFGVYTFIDADLGEPVQVFFYEDLAY